MDTIGWGVLGPGRIARSLRDRPARSSPTRRWWPPGRATSERAAAFAAEFGGRGPRLLRGAGGRPRGRRRVRRHAARPPRRAHPAGPRGGQGGALREADDARRRDHDRPVRRGGRPRAVPDGGHVDGLPPDDPDVAPALLAERRPRDAPDRSTPPSASWSPAPRTAATQTGRLLDPALGGGALLDMGIYPLTFAHLVLGEPERLTAVANLSAGGHRPRRLRRRALSRRCDRRADGHPHRAPVGDRHRGHRDRPLRPAAPLLHPAADPVDVVLASPRAPASGSSPTSRWSAGATATRSSRSTAACAPAP